jgi:hypothetical protein
MRRVGDDYETAAEKDACLKEDCIWAMYLMMSVLVRKAEKRSRNNRDPVPRSKRDPLREQIPGEEEKMTKFRGSGREILCCDVVLKIGGW